jgi:circadian clock protein KaiB
MVTTPTAHESSSERALRLRLFVAGDAPNSVTAIATLRAEIEQSRIPAELEVIDVLREPERGLAEGVLLTPMLIRVQPPPERRILGNLSNRAALLGVLTLGGARQESPDAPDSELHLLTASSREANR